MDVGESTSSRTNWASEMDGSLTQPSGKLRKKKNVEIYKNNRRGRKLVVMRIVCLKS